MKSDLIAPVLAMLFLALPCASAVSAQQPATDAARPAKVMTIEAAATEVVRRYPAIVRSSQEAELSFKVSGQVVALPVRGASVVAAGDVIARVDDRAFNAALTQLQSQRDQAEAQLQALRSGARSEEIAALEAEVSAARAQYTQARDQLERSRKLAEQNIVAEARLDQDQAAADVAQARLQAAEEQLAIGRAGGRAEDIAAAEAQLRGLDSQIANARDNLDDTTLRAPFDEIIVRRHIDNFTNVQAGQPIALLQAVETVDIAFSVPGPDILIWSGNADSRATVELDALPGDAIPAEMVEFARQAEGGTMTYSVRLRVVVPDGATVLPGMVGTVTVSSAAAANAAPVISVPLTAIGAAADNSPFVWLVDPAINSVSAQPVTLGDMSGATVALTDGVEPGMRIVTAGVSYLRAGDTIRPITAVGE